MIYILYLYFSMRANETFVLFVCVKTTTIPISSQDAGIETAQVDQPYSTDEISTGKGAGRVLGHLA